MNCFIFSCAPEIIDSNLVILWWSSIFSFCSSMIYILLWATFWSVFFTSALADSFYLPMWARSCSSSATFAFSDWIVISSVATFDYRERFSPLDSLFSCFNSYSLLYYWLFLSPSSPFSLCNSLISSPNSYILLIFWAFSSVILYSWSCKSSCFTFNLFSWSVVWSRPFSFWVIIRICVFSRSTSAVLLPAPLATLCPRMDTPPLPSTDIPTLPRADAPPLLITDGIGVGIAPFAGRASIGPTFDFCPSLLCVSGLWFWLAALLVLWVGVAFMASR